METSTEAYSAAPEEAARAEDTLSKLGRSTNWLVSLWFADDGTPNSPQRVQEIYAARSRWMWRRTIFRSIFGLCVAGVAVPLLLHTVDRFGAPPRFIWPIAATFALCAVSSITSGLYSTWAQTLPMDFERDVFVWPVEIGLTILAAVTIAVFASVFFLNVDHLGFLAFTAAVTAIGGGGILWNHVKVMFDRGYPTAVAPCWIGADERIAAAAAGIVWDGRFRDRVHDMSNRSLMPWSGRRLSRAAQNALLVTDARLYFVYVPLPLGNRAGDARTIVFSFGSQLVRAKLDDMLRRMSLPQIYASSPLNFALDRSDIKRIKVSEPGLLYSQSIDIFDRDDKKLTITFRHREDFERVASALRDGA